MKSSKTQKAGQTVLSFMESLATDTQAKIEQLEKLVVRAKGYERKHGEAMPLSLVLAPPQPPTGAATAPARRATTAFANG